VNSNLHRIWFVGSGVWFFNALLSMHHRVLSLGLVEAGIAAAFLATGLLFQRQRERALRDRDAKRR
jgi:hypothetical protein